MKLFKEEYSALFEGLAPSPALSEEAVALMAEAQNHPAPKAAAAPKKKWILPAAISGAAALVAVAIGLGIWLDRPQVIVDKKGDLDAVLGSITFPEKHQVVEKDPTTQTDPEETLPQEEEGAQEEEQDQGEQTAPPIDYENAPTGDTAPIILNDRNTETYRSLNEFITYLGKKETIGYKTNYLADPALVVVPTFLPQTARFRHLHLEEDGAYSYSYVITKEGKQYFLDIALKASFPKAQRDIKIRTDAIIKGEVIDYDRRDHQRIYYVGKYDVATVTVTALSGEQVTAEMVDALLMPFELGRYNKNNPYLDLRYE